MIMKNRVKNLKKNSGFTLVELMVSVAIFALICSPLLHAFLTAQSTSRRSHYLGDATLSSRNVIETIKASGAEDVINQLRADANPFTSNGFEIQTLDNDNGIYAFDLLGYSAGMSRFDLRVMLSAGDFNDINNMQIVDYSPMDGVFAQSDRDDENPDILAARYLADREIISNNEFCTCDELEIECNCWEKMRGLYNRVITVTAHENGDNVSITVTYYYKFGGYDFEWQREFYRGKTADSANIYVCYQPRYGVSDNIEIENKPGMNLSVFLVNQDMQEHYNNANITLLESEGTDTDTVKTRVFANFKRPYEIRAFNPAVIDYKFSEMYWVGNKETSGELVSRSQQNRMYAVTIHVYREGELAAGGRHLLRTQAAQFD